ncbi:MATE family efflux transporter [Clostridium sp. NSJ-145]|uniref:MATE family efflux transporter n=1 Tax=Clostridium sp. NSJ-145 TaxID=2897777 RepID=UPI002ED96281
MLKVGSPLALQDALVNISFLLITVIVNSMGLIASASVGVVEKIIIFAMLPPTAFASAVATMTAQNMGANKPDRAIKGLKYGIGYSLICGILVCIYCQFLPHTITSIFTKDVEVIASAAMYLKSYSFDCILVAFIFCMNSYFSGCGRSMIAFIHSMIATFVVRIPMSYLMSKVPNTSLFKMGLASPVASFVSVGICFGYFIWLKKYNSQAKSTEEYITMP